MKTRQLIDLIQLEDNEKLLLIGDESTDWLVDGLARFAETIYFLDSESRPLTEVPLDLEKLFEGIDVLLYVISKHGSEERVFRDKLNKAAESRGIRVGNLLDVRPEIMQSAFSADVYDVKEFTEQLFEHMQPVQEVHVTTPAGSDFTVSFDEKYNWLSSTGFIQYKKTRNVMPAEIFTYPAIVNGTIVVDGAYAALVGRDDSDTLLAQLQKTPITWIVSDSKIIEVHCVDERILEIAQAEIDKDSEYGNHIGEFGMGTNLGMTELFGNVMHDEKYPGIHIAHGHGYPSATGAPYESSVHSDGILLNVSVQDVNSREWILKDGEYQIHK
jgi:leucyl aminopeptidase (aminopeptidase T)